MTRRIALPALLLAAAAAAGHTSCIALLCYEDETCAEGSGGTGATTASSTGVTTATGATATAAVGTGGAGGAGGNECVDTLTDPDNCGACGHECFAGQCQNGFCGEASFDLKPNDSSTKLGPVHVRSDGVVLVPAAAPACQGTPCIHRIPTDFNGASTQAIAVPDISGMWGGSPERSYYAPQLSNVIVTCDDQACGTAPITSTAGHFNGPTRTLGSLFVLEANSANLLRFDLNVQGQPSGVAVQVLTMQMLGTDGPHMMFAKPGSENVFFTTYGAGGCLYLQNVDTPPASPVSCHASLPTGNGPVALAVDPGGIPFVIGVLPGPVYWMPQTTLDPLGSLTVRPPIDVDDRFVYVRSAIDGAGDGMLVLDRTTGAQLHKVLEAPITSIDARHPDFVFFTAGMPADANAIYRWRKPPPP